MSSSSDAHADDQATRIVGGPAIGAAAPSTAAAPAADDDATIIRTATGLFAPSGMSTRPGGTTGTPGQAAGDAAGEAPGAGLLPIGTRVAEFEITRVVGQGGFGVVYEAWDHTLERTVAVKEYLPTSLSTRQPGGAVVPLSERHRETFELGMRSFINEARLLAQFDHPSLLKVYRFWEERGTTYMVMPFYRGETLRQTLAAQPGTATEAWLLDIMDGVTQALAVMHAARCYHRDIAPDNILLLEGSGRPVVLDFGAARRVITDQTQAMTVILKPGYAPIEQYAEVPDMDQGPWTDVYALAAVLHTAVCGRPPAPSVARMMADTYRPLAQDPALAKRFSPRFLAGIDTGLALRPEQRLQSMQALRIALGLPDTGPAAEAAAAHAPARGRGAAAAPAPRRGGLPVLQIAAVAGALLLAGGGYAWWSSRAPAAGAAAPVAAAPAPAAAPASPPPAAPPAPAATPRTPEQSLASLADGATPGFTVSATARKAEVSIGRDKLGFEVRSNRAGNVYVFLLSTGGEMVMLFPNLLDKYNTIKANETLVLPRASWPMDSGGPAGTNRFAVVVSERERDFGASGAQNDGVFTRFPLPVLAALEATRGNGPPPLLGRPVCPAGAADCTDPYGVGNFTIVEK